jgi:hypothetical protein
MSNFSEEERYIQQEVQRRIQDYKRQSFYRELTSFKPSLQTEKHKIDHKYRWLKKKVVNGVECLDIKWTWVVTVIVCEIVIALSPLIYRYLNIM